MNLRELPNDGTLAVESSKLIVKTVHNLKVLCHADSIIDDDDEMIESALLNLAASRRQKDRAPSSMILHRHMHARNSQEFYPQQNSIVHQKLKGQTDLDNEMLRVHTKELPTDRSQSVLPNLTTKIAVAPTFLQLFDLDSSRTGRTNECSVYHEQSSMRIEVHTPVRTARSAIEKNSWNDVPFCPTGPCMPAALRKPRTPLATTGQNWSSSQSPSSSVLELAAPYSKNYVENYKSKIRHSRLGHLYGQLRRDVSTPKNPVRLEKVRNDRCVENDENPAQQRIPTSNFPSRTFQRHDGIVSEDSALVSSPSEDSHVDCLERDSEMISRNDDTLICADRSFCKEDVTSDPFEEMERERMLRQVQRMYSDVPFEATLETIGSNGGALKYQRGERLEAAELRTLGTKCTQNLLASRRKGAESKILTVVMPYNEDFGASARSHMPINTNSEANISSKPGIVKPENVERVSENRYKMSVNILRPFESIVDMAQKQCTSTAIRVTKNQHATPVAVMLASSSLMN